MTAQQIPAQVRSLCHLILTHAQVGQVTFHPGQWSIPAGSRKATLDVAPYAAIVDRPRSMLTDWAIATLLACGLIAMSADRVHLTELGCLTLRAWDAEVMGVDPLDSEDQ